MKKLFSLTISALLLSVGGLASAQSPSTVLVVANANNSQSLALASHYMTARKVPSENLLKLNWKADDNADTITLADYATLISKPIYARIAQLPQIDYIVLCRNLPYKLSNNGCSVDSCLASKGTTMAMNKYYTKAVPF